MNRNSMFPRIVLLATVIAISSACVSKKKYQQLDALKTGLQRMLDQKENELNELQKEKMSVDGLLKECVSEKEKLKRENSAISKAKGDTDKKLAELDATCKQMNENYMQLKSQSTKQMRELIDDLESARSKLNAAQESLATTQANLAAREARLLEVESKLHERDSLMDALKSRIAKQLFGFSDKGFSVEIRDGKVYISLSNQLLFATGSTQIDKKGQEALKELGSVLKEQNDINILVEGHTDNVKVTNLGQIKDNWDLSVMRSTEVVRLLVTNGVDPLRVTASGRGEFMPVDAEDTPDARAKNRRTEIILTPKLDELYQMLKGDQ